jgi:phosphotransferase system  glucose/maltose/N-acetylglucosamine-specific IIC component
MLPIYVIIFNGIMLIFASMINNMDDTIKTTKENDFD